MPTLEISCSEGVLVAPVVTSRLARDVFTSFSVVRVV